MKISHKSDYKKLRASEYPSIAEQLDSLWHAMDSGALAKAEPFYSDIKTIKDKYPKGDRNESNNR